MAMQGLPIGLLEEHRARHIRGLLVVVVDPALCGTVGTHQQVRAIGVLRRLLEQLINVRLTVGDAYQAGVGA